MNGEVGWLAGLPKAGAAGAGAGADGVGLPNVNVDAEVGGCGWDGWPNPNEGAVEAVEELPNGLDDVDGWPKLKVGIVLVEPNGLVGPGPGCGALGLVGDSSIESPPPLFVCGSLLPNAVPLPPAPLPNPLPLPPNVNPPTLLLVVFPNPPNGVVVVLFSTLLSFVGVPNANGALDSLLVVVVAAGLPKENAGLEVAPSPLPPNKLDCDPPNANGCGCLFSVPDVGVPKLNVVDGCKANK